MEQIMMCTLYMPNYYLCDFFKKNIDNKKIEESDGADDDVYMLHVKIYATKTYTKLER
jgi:hypothetical protein